MAALYSHNSGEIRRILVAEDVGGDAGLAVRLARRLAQSSSGTEVTILRVVSPLPGVDFSIERIAVEELIRGELGEVEANIEARVVQADSVADAVLEEAASGYDLLIIGAPEKAIWHSWLGGATADEIVERAPCSVLLVKEQQQEPSSLLERVLKRLVGAGAG